MKKILGLDLGTNSIGWAVVSEEHTEDTSYLTGIDGVGCRIIPMSADQIGDFEKGNNVSQTKERTGYRGTRRLRERFLLRRERLHRTLKIMGFLPEHYAASIDEFGKFHKGTEPKIDWRKSVNGKYEFTFQTSFNEMLDNFQALHPELSDRKIPADWTLYYLRKKALTEKISKEELAWILLNFNQKRGYYQLRGEDDEKDTTKREEYMKLTVVDVIDTGEKKGKAKWYNIKLSNGLIYKRSAEQPIDWIGKEKEFIITTQLEKDGSAEKDKDGEPKITIRSLKDDDWNLLKKRTETDIKESCKTVGEYIYDHILSTPDIKIIGKLVRTIERKYYRAELKEIIRKQSEFHQELTDMEFYAKCINELYPNNEAYRNSIARKDFVYLLAEDIIFYQRPLKSKKHLISNCPYESRTFRDEESGQIKSAPIKCIAKSNPLFQEFRIWQFISNLRIYSNDGNNKDITDKYLSEIEDWERLFDFLNDRKDIDQATFISKFLGHKKIGDKFPVRWNYVEDKKYPCNKTRHTIASKLTKEEGSKLNTELLVKIWHLLYSVKTKEEIDSVFSDNKIGDNGIYDDLLKHFSKESIAKIKNIKIEEEDYGSYSEKAIRKLLSLMRLGKYWSTDLIDPKTHERIEKILSGECDAGIKDSIRQRAERFTCLKDFQGLPVWLACYVVYGRHSESKEAGKWYSPKDIDIFLAEFKQHSMRNPIVEQVVMETLRTVRDIWIKIGHIDEIHIELGRELKSTKEQREQITRQNTENENTNQRIRTLLTEFMNPEFGIEGVRPSSPTQQNILKIYEAAVLQGDRGRNEEINSIISKLNASDPAKQPTRSEILRYKLWLDQKYCSPYTGQPIPLAKLFTHEYEIEHIIPQSRYFDDSFQNKVICESEVNKLKDRMLGKEFIDKHHGEIVTLSGGRTVTILSCEAYEEFVKKHYSGNRAKLRNLLLEDIPDGFIERQMNDTRYISKYIIGLLSNIVREEIAPGVYEEGATSMNLIACNGSITTRLKKDWGLNDVWNSIILPRFIHLNKICKTDRFTSTNSEGHIIPDLPDELLRGFNKKRIDHRHHAMDAIVIACATRSHIHLLNNEAAKSSNKAIRHQLSHKLRRYEKIIINGEEKQVAREFLKPWDTFTQDVYKILKGIIISFKQNQRVINKASNKYISYYDEDGKLRLDKAGHPVKGMTVQKANASWWAIRKPMHKDTVFGKVHLRKTKEIRLSFALTCIDSIIDKELKNELKRLVGLGYDEKRIKKFFSEGENKDIWAEFNPNKIKVYYFTEDTYATRKTLDDSFDEKKIKTSVTDTGIQKILINHLKESGGDPKIAFSPDGIDRMNANLTSLNGGKMHKPIYKVRVYEAASKFAVGTDGNKKDKYVEAAKGTNLYFGVYADSKGVRSYETVALNDVIERLKNGLAPVPEVNGQNAKLLFCLSPNDLVYVPSEEEISKGTAITQLVSDRIYKIVSFTNKRIYGIPYNVSKVIVDKVEYTQLNKIEFISEKGICIPIKVDRLGNIVYVGTEFLSKH